MSHSRQELELTCEDDDDVPSEQESSSEWDGILSSLSPSISVYHDESWSNNGTEMSFAAFIEFEKHHPKQVRGHLITSFANMSHNYGAVCLPRLDLLVENGHLSTLRWLFENEYVRPGVIVFHAKLKDDESSTDKVEEEDDDACAICLSGKQNPFSYSCNHSFCQRCIEEMVVSRRLNGQAKCPLCMTECIIPNPIYLALRLRYSVLTRHPWLPVFDGMTALEVLLGLAAGRDSIHIFVWLIEKWSMDPLKFVFRMVTTFSTSPHLGGPHWFAYGCAKTDIRISSVWERLGRDSHVESNSKPMSRCE
ncbi:hypothetical protein BC829DRAFT_66442 [Chytridium lagenaria]|nr:hypothetical protein BC829DRAFT_66442 [Chytridium lagenaria]